MEIHKNSTKCILIIISSSYYSNYFHEIRPTSTPAYDFNYDGYDYTLDILMPLVVGLLVALILGWMLIRYKMSSHQRSNYNGSIYCCPEECFDFCAKFFECKIKWPKVMKRDQTNNRDIALR